jgi:hypothetical protein
MRAPMAPRNFTHRSERRAAEHRLETRGEALGLK